MMFWSEISTKIKNAFSFNAKKRDSSTKTTAIGHKTIQYTLEVANYNKTIPIREIRKVIMLNPWSAIVKPKILQRKNDQDEPILEVKFYAINSANGKLIEQQLRSLLSP